MKRMFLGLAALAFGFVTAMGSASAQTNTVKAGTLVCDVSAEVIRALDEDDWIALREKALDFLPRRFREAAASLSRTPGA